MFHAIYTKKTEHTMVIGEKRRGRPRRRTQSREQREREREREAMGVKTAQ